jgi:hypothetical protein
VVALHVDRDRCHDAATGMTNVRPAEPMTDLVEPEETVDGVPVLAAEVRAIEPLRRSLPARQTAAVAATGFVAGAATIVAIHRRSVRKAGNGRRIKKRGGSDALSVLGTRSFLLDVHLLGRE